MTRKLTTSLTLTIAFVAAAALSACSGMDNNMTAKPAQTDQNPAHQMHYSEQ